MRTVPININTAGTAGSATGNNSSEEAIYGFLWAIYFNFHASTPATTDTTVTQVMEDGTEITLFTLSNTVTDALKHVRVAEVDSANAALSTYSAPLLCGQKVKVALAQSDALTNALVAYLLILE